MRACCVFILLLAVLPAAPAGGDGAELQARPPRLANGVVIEGVIEEISGDGLVIRKAAGDIKFHWRHLSAGTRYRHQDIDERALADDDE